MKLNCSCGQESEFKVAGEDYLDTIHGEIAFNIHEVERFYFSYREYDGVLTLKCRTCSEEVNVQL